MLRVFTFENRNIARFKKINPRSKKKRPKCKTNTCLFLENVALILLPSRIDPRFRAIFLVFRAILR